MKVREFFRYFEPYEWETSSLEIALKTGLNVDQIIRFDTNASPVIPTNWLSNLSSKLEDVKINDYPDTSYLNLRKALSKYINIDYNRIIVTNGADEGLDIIVKSFIDEGTIAVLSTPTYSYYKVITQIAGGNTISVPRKEYFVDDEENLVKAAKKEDTRIIFLCSPNNPTGNSTKKETIIRLLEESDSIVVVDEAYSEFSGINNIDLTDKYDNLVVIRTFSKAFSLAGARVGYIISSRKTIDILNKVRPPNSVSSISLALAEFGLSDIEKVKDNIKFMIKERDKCKAHLEKINRVKVYPSETNFLLVEFNCIPVEHLYKLLLRRGLVVRNLSHITGLEKCLRFNIRLPDQNEILLSTISEIISHSTKYI